MVAKKNTDPIWIKMMVEQNQHHETRKKLYSSLEDELKMPVISFFTSFRYPVIIEDGDAQMLEGLLQKIDLSKGLALCLNSPGGLGESSERIINICRTYSGTKEFIAVVPGKAKSAATMICMGASKIMMGKTSELGPVDPQILIKSKEGDVSTFALCNIVDSYNKLFNSAVNTKGKIEPFLQQLSTYDPRKIKEYEVAIELSKDVSVRALRKGMMKNKTVDQIRKSIAMFLTPKQTKSHGRSIFYEDAIQCGLNIEVMDEKSKLWELFYELCLRTENYTNSRVSKCIENKDFGFTVGISD
jgi:ClpP class serine protease